MIFACLGPEKTFTCFMCDPRIQNTEENGDQMPLFQLDNLSKRYQLGETEVQALKNVYLEIDSAEFMVIWGPSGSGKTTLLNMLSTIDRPSSGTLKFNGKDIGQLDDHALTGLRLHQIGVIFQSFNLIPVISALENVMLPLQLQGVSPVEATRRANALLEEVDVVQHANRRPDKLSGGQRQRVAIARALITNPKAVIADEPTANLDSENTTRIIELMSRLNKEHQVTFIFSTHDPLLIDVAERKVQLRDGAIVQSKGSH